MCIYWTYSSVSLPFLYWETKTGKDTPDVVTSAQYTGSWCAGYTLSNTSNYTINLYCYKAILLTDVQLVTPGSQLFFLQNFYFISPRQYCCMWIINSRFGTFCLPLLNFMNFCQPSLSKSHWTATLLFSIPISSSKFSFLCRLVEGAFCPVIQVTHEDIRWYQP